jgi:hypothetical protein
MREVEVAIQSGGSPYSTDLNPSVIDGSRIGEVGFFSIGEVELDIRKEFGLISFYREVVVGLASDQVARKIALCQKGVGGDVLALDVDGVKERDSCLDLVCAFDLFIFYPKGAHFFWV